MDELDTEEDDLLSSLILVASEYIRNATGFKLETNVPETAKLIAKLLVSHWYENRAVVSTQMQNKIDFTVKVLLAQLTYTHTEVDTP